jgi:predicted RNA methylase
VDGLDSLVKKPPESFDMVLTNPPFGKKQRGGGDGVLYTHNTG